MSAEWRVVCWKLHLNPFKPVDCIGAERWFFGWYAIVTDGTRQSCQTAEQVRIKRSMGILR